MSSYVLAPREGVERAVAGLAIAELSEQTIARLAVLMSQFAGFVERGHGIGELGLVTAKVVEGFIAAPISGGGTPGASLQYFRRLAVRQLFRTCRELGYEVGDPSIDVAVPSRARAQFRALEDDEVELARAATVEGVDLRRSAAWALCEATARTGELPALIRGDVDVDDGRVWLHGSPRLDERWGVLTEWGQLQLRRHLDSLPAGVDVPVIGGGRPGSSLAQSSAVGVIGRTLRRAGLSEDPAVRPSSIAAWAGRKLLGDTGEIALVARRLGMRSLDRTAFFVGWDWQHSSD